MFLLSIDPLIIVSAVPKCPSVQSKIYFNGKNMKFVLMKNWIYVLMLVSNLMYILIVFMSYSFCIVNKISLLQNYI